MAKEDEGCDVCPCAGFEFDHEDKNSDRICICGHFEDEHNVQADDE